MDEEYEIVAQLIKELKKAIYSLIDEYNRCIHEVKNETQLHEKFPPLTAEELEEKVTAICREKCNEYIGQFDTIDQFFHLLLENKDISEFSDSPYVTFFSKLWLGDYYDTKSLKGIKAFEHYISSLSKEKDNVQENSFNKIFYHHF